MAFSPNKTLHAQCDLVTKQYQIEEKHPLNAPAYETHNVISNAESKQLGFWDAWSPDFYMCDSVPLANADTDSVSLQA